MKIRNTALKSIMAGSPMFILLIFATTVFAGDHGPSELEKKSEPIRVLIVGGGASHDFNKWYREVDVKTLERDQLADVLYTNNTDSITYYLSRIDVLFLCNNQPINDPEARKAIFEFVNKGNGLILAHPAIWYNWKDWPEYNLKLAGGGSTGHDRYGSFQVTITNTNHPVTAGIKPEFTLKDERYYYIPDNASTGIQVLASSSVEGSEKIYPSVFVVNNPKARIVGIALGHDGESHNLPQYQTLIRNSVKWVAKRKKK